MEKDGIVYSTKIMLYHFLPSVSDNANTITNHSCKIKGLNLHWAMKQKVSTGPNRSHDTSVN